MILVNRAVLLDRAIERYKHTKRMGRDGKEKLFPLSPFTINETLKKLKELKMAKSFKVDRLKDIVGPDYMPITCDECKQPADSIVVFEETEVPHEGGPFGFCKKCLLKAARMIK